MPHRNQKIFNEGWQAWTDGAHVNENPYHPISSNERAAMWLEGWKAAEEDQLEQDEEADRAESLRDDYGDRVDWEHDRNR